MTAQPQSTTEKTGALDAKVSSTELWYLKLFAQQDAKAAIDESGVVYTVVTETKCSLGIESAQRLVDIGLLGRTGGCLADTAELTPAAQKLLAQSHIADL